ncbi:hypothetical protein [Thalassovita aquimarina]|uniref:Uncharacterized protein n=1 Tax=Thalassovita aquimarina TaxID=2785917 RepID=A0ABS5HSH0_9RHOB|nr:hypothetical protein [Thalassovita aquimarina]MBR9651912.1 hypothetical protein [Thalassovita aquimarina]
MSMTMMALRIAAVQALKAGGTLVGDNVLDSQISAIDQTADGRLRSDQQRPFIAVYTDAAKSQDLAQTGLRSNGRVDIMLNSGVSLTMAQTDKATGEASIVEGFPATDAHFEAVLDVLDVQIGRVLTDPDNEWAQVFGDFVQRYVAKEHLRSSSAAENVRLAAGQTRLTVEVLADPRLGQPLAEGGAWMRFMALMEQYDVPQLAMFRQLLGAAEAGNYAEFERLTGMTVKDAETLRLYTFGGVQRDVVVTGAASDAGIG